MVNRSLPPGLNLRGLRPELTIREEGANHTYHLRSLPATLAMAIVEQKIPSSALRKAACGAFWAMDREGDRKQARRLWKAAIDVGAKVKELLAEVEEPPPEKRNSSASRKSAPPTAIRTAKR